MNMRTAYRLLGVVALAGNLAACGEAKSCDDKGDKDRKDDCGDAGGHGGVFVAGHGSSAPTGTSTGTTAGGEAHVGDAAGDGTSRSSGGFGETGEAAHASGSSGHGAGE